MTRRHLIQGLGAIFPTLRFIAGQYVDVDIELRAAAIRGEDMGDGTFWAGGIEEMAPLPNRIKWTPVTGVEFPERARFENGVSC